ncbi:MAG: cytochrome c oxidase subunit II [Anaerolineales bacterium]
MGPISPFDPASGQALAISNLFILTLAIGGIVFLLVTSLVVYASIRYRSRQVGADPKQVFGNRRMEIAWTAAPAGLLLVLFGFTLHAMAVSDPPVSPSESPDMVIVAHQWWWEVRYPQDGVVTANEVHLPVGRPIRLRLESADVIHDFWVPALGRKMDATPGHPVTYSISVDKPGIYLGTCAEFCGAQHAWMRIRVVAQSPADFNRWLSQQAAVPTPAKTEAATRGAQLFQSLTCSSCHAIAGTPAQAHVGPDLTHLADRQTLGAGVLDNTPDNLKRWLTNPQAYKPGSYMPNLHLSPDQVDALVAYLESLK